MYLRVYTVPAEFIPKYNQIIHAENLTNSSYVLKTCTYLRIGWKRKNVKYSIMCPINKISIFQKHICVNGNNFSFEWYGQKSFPAYVSANISIKRLYDRIVVSDFHGPIIDRKERIQLMAKELLFCKHKKELKQCIKKFREKRRKIIIEEGSKYLIPDLCNMIVEMVQR
jgi:hypothetical protein